MAYTTIIVDRYNLYKMNGLAFLSVIASIVSSIAVDPATLCHDILQLDCATYIPLDKDETVCGSDGVHYNNFCYFTQARCHNPTLVSQSLGNCGTLNGGGTPAPSVTSAPTRPNRNTTTAAATTHRHPAITTTRKTLPPTTTTTMKTTTTTTRDSTMTMTTDWTTTMTTTTMDPVVSLFCQNKDSIACPTKIDLKCGSNKKLYLNDCQFAKAHCEDTSLVKVDISVCRH